LDADGQNGNTRRLQEYQSHRDADGVDPQFFQTLNISLGEPGLPMVVEDFVSGVRVCPGEIAVDWF